MDKLRRFIEHIDRQVRSEETAAFLRTLAGCILFLAVLAALVELVQLFRELWMMRASAHSAIVNLEAKTTPIEILNLQNEMLKTLFQAVGGVFVLIALYFTYCRVKVAEQGHIVAEQGHITDRYTKAIEQLGAIKADKDGNKPNIEVRLGAIYALERIAQDSARDHWPIMEVLTAYVRQNAPAPAQEPSEEENKAAIAKKPTTEIQAILTVLGRRQRDGKRESKEKHLDLTGSDLRGAFLSEAHLDRTRFGGAYLDEALFIDAHLDGANFDKAHLDGTRFDKAHLDKSWFFGAHLCGAWFIEAHLEDAQFGGAHLHRAQFCRAHLNGANLFADLDGANFQCAVGLKLEQVRGAQNWKKAQFDEGFLQEPETNKVTQYTPSETIPDPKKARTSSPDSGKEE